MSGQHTPGPCHVERAEGKLPFAIKAPYNDGLPGSVTLGMFAYKPHADFFAAAPEMLAFIERIAQRDPVFAKWHEKIEIADARLLVAKAKGGAA